MIWCINSPLSNQFPQHWSSLMGISWFALHRLVIPTTLVLLTQDSPQHHRYGLQAILDGLSWYKLAVYVTMHKFICSTAKLKGLKYCLSPLLFCLEVRSMRHISCWNTVMGARYQYKGLTNMSRSVLVHKGLSHSLGPLIQQAVDL